MKIRAFFEERQNLYIIIRFGLIVGYIIIMIYRCSYVPIDSDYSNLVLEANDIIHGNVLLTGWIQTGISFLTTDLLFFIVGSVFGGVSVVSYYIAIGLMMAVAVLLGFFLFVKHSGTWMESAYYILLCAIPGVMLAERFRAHTGAVCWVFLCVWLTERELRSHDTKKLFFLALFMCLGVWGDALALIMGALPIAVLCAVGLLRGENGKRIYSWILATVAAGVTMGLVFDKLYYVIGGAEKNDFLGLRKFEPFENLPQKFAIYLEAVFQNSDASFFGENVLSRGTLGLFVNAVIVVFGFVVIFRELALFIRDRQSDIISTLFSIGILTVSAVFILTDIAVNVSSSRYIAYFPIVFCVMIIRNREWLSKLFKVSSKTISVSLLLLGLISFAFRADSVFNVVKGVESKQQLGEFLAKNGLEEGYGSFWNASSVTVLSGDRVKVRAVYNDSGISQYRWFCKNEWYHNEATFVVTSEDDMYNVTQENVIKSFGPPSEVLAYLEWEILVYDHTIEPQNFSISNSSVLAHEFMSNEYAYLNNMGDYVMEPGAIVFGPYEAIEAGAYYVTIYGDNLDCVEMDSYSNELGGNLVFEVLTKNETETRAKVFVPKAISDIEFREFNNSDEKALFSSISIEKSK